MTKQIIAEYVKATSRLLLLDYDGTLVAFKAHFEEAVPGPNLTVLLGALASDPGNTVVVTSGRPPEILEAWFGNLGITLIAEHGFFVKHPGQPWQAHHADMAWKRRIRPLMETTAAATPGSFLEEKASALVWHYRSADALTAATAAEQLVLALTPLMPDMGLRCLRGNKVVEVKIAGITKGTAALHLLSEKPYAFVLAAGDDATDEDMFTALPHTAYTVKVGEGATSARHRLPAPKDLSVLLHSMTTKK